MSGRSAGLSKSQEEKIQSDATLKITQRKRAGEWGGSIRPHTEYQTRPIEWITEHLDVAVDTIIWSRHPAYQHHKWDGDVDPLALILTELGAGRDVGVESGTGTGKTFLAACITFWFLACFKDSLVIQIAPKESQLLRGVWKEIGRLWSKFVRYFPDAELLTGKLRMSDAVGEQETWAASALVAGVGADEDAATKAQGSHAAHMLHITEETPGIHRAIMVAIKETRTDDHNIHLALGNPNHRKDQLHQFCELPTTTAVRVSAFDHPNVVTGTSLVPGAIGRRRLKERIADLGKGSRLYQTRIRGISPAESEDALILQSWCEMAAEKYNDPEYREGALALGVDVADSESGDRGSISRWQGACCTEVISFPCPDGNLLGLRVAREMEDDDNPIDERHVGVDSVGVGAGCVNELKRLGHKVRRISGATRAIPGVDKDELWSVTATDIEGRTRPRGSLVIEAELFGNQRDQVWWRLREDLRLGRIALPWDQELFDDLTTPEYTTKGGIIRVQTKDEIKKLLKRSPDKGDACAYGNFVRRRRPLSLERNNQYPRDPDTDYGLEKMLVQREKKRIAEEKRVTNLLRARGRAVLKEQRR